MREKVGAQPEAEHRQVLLVHKLPQLFDMLGGEELAFVHDHHVVPAARGIKRADIVLRPDNVGGRLQSDARAEQGFPVAAVDGGLQKPHVHAALLIIEFCDERVRGLARAHRAVFEIELRHFCGHLLSGFYRFA